MEAERKSSNGTQLPNIKFCKQWMSTATCITLSFQGLHLTFSFGLPHQIIPTSQVCILKLSIRFVFLFIYTCKSNTTFPKNIKNKYLNVYHQNTKKHKFNGYVFPVKLSDRDNQFSSFFISHKRISSFNMKLNFNTFLHTFIIFENISINN